MIVLDIETVASPDVESFLDPVKAPANYKDPEKIAAYRAEKLSDMVARAALEPDLCEVLAIGFTLDEGQTIASKTRESMSEAELITAAWRAIGEHQIVGFNSLGFDLPVLIRRSQLLGLKFDMPMLDRYRTPHVDLMQKLTFNGALTYRPLTFYCRRFGLRVPEDDVTGADIAQLVIDGNWKAIDNHVRSDVAKTTALANRLGLLPAF